MPVKRPHKSRADCRDPLFALLRKIAERNGLPCLSMGMSDDFEIAVEEGSHIVRVGSALFAGLSGTEVGA